MGSSASKVAVKNEPNVRSESVAKPSKDFTNEIQEESLEAVENDGDKNNGTAHKTKEEILTLVEEKLCELNGIELKWKKNGKAIFQLLLKHYYSYGKSMVEDIADLMVKHHFVAACNELWKHYLEYEDLNAVYTKFKTIYYMKLTLWNYTDKSKSLCKEIYRTREIIEKCMGDFSTPELEVEELKLHEKRFYLKGTLGILLNVVRHCNEASSIIRQNDGVSKLLEYQKSTYLIVKAKVMILLAYCVDDQESEKLLTGIGVITFILKLLKSALNSPKHIAKTYMFSATETVEGLDKLASNDHNKQAMVEEGILPMLKDLLSPDSSKKEHEVTIHCLWTLSFHPENKEKIKQEEGLLDAVTVISQDPASSQATLKSCDGLLFVLGVKLKKPPKKKKKKRETSSGHVMISYQWGVQPTILQLRDYLKANDFKVWIDVDEAKGSILSAMADAVENAAVVVVAMTESYKNSNPCRTEAEYAYKLSKPIVPLLLEESYSPDGWLGALLGMQLYIDISTTDSLDSGYGQIAQSINNKVGGDLEIPTEEVTKNPLTISPNHSSSAISSWSIRDVQEWAKKQDIRGLEMSFSEINGDSLLQLQKMMKKCPELYYTIIKTEFHLSLVEILKFTHSLENL